MAQERKDRDRVVLGKVLIEVRGKEQQLQVALQAQIAGAQTRAIRELLVGHLAVTDRQVAALSARIDAVGARSSAPLAGRLLAGVGGGAVALANRGLALAKGPLVLLRGTSAADRQLRDLRDCYWNEAEEIAHYRVLEALAEELGDRDTAELARRHRAEEEEMQQALEELIPVQVVALVEREAPPAHRSAAAHAQTTRRPTSQAKRRPSGQAKPKPAGQRRTAKSANA